MSLLFPSPVKGLAIVYQTSMQYEYKNKKKGHGPFSLILSFGSRLGLDIFLGSSSYSSFSHLLLLSAFSSACTSISQVGGEPGYLTDSCLRTFAVQLRSVKHTITGRFYADSRPKSPQLRARGQLAVVLYALLLRRIRIEVTVSLTVRALQVDSKVLGMLMFWSEQQKAAFSLGVMYGRRVKLPKHQQAENTRKTS